MDVRPIRTEADHKAALKEIDRLWGAKIGTTDGDKLDVLATLVEAYEKQHYPIEEPEPIPYLKAIMEFGGRTQTDLAKVLGSRARASEVLARRRYLSKAQIIKLRDTWGFPIEPLLKPYPLVKTKARKPVKAKAKKPARRLAA